MKKFYLLILLCFGISFYILTSYTHVASHLIYTDWFLRFFGVFVFYVSGCGNTVLLQWLLKRHFNIPEFLVLSILGNILVFPLILEIEYLAIGKVTDILPWVNAFTVLGIASALIFFKKTTLFSSKETLLFFRNSIPLFIVLFLHSIFVLTIVTKFPALPDLDPYKWLYKYTVLFSAFQLDTIERPLFGSLTFIGTRLFSIDIFTYFKYGLPTLFTLTVFPVWLVAEKFTDQIRKLLFLSLLFISPVILLYGTTSMPQQPMIILSYFFISSLLYSHLTKDLFFFYLAGGISFLGFFYHQSSAILLVSWTIVAVSTHWKKLLSNKTTLILLVALIVSNREYIQPIYGFLLNWLQIIYANAWSDHLLNPLFPAHYTNIDKNAMGWPGLDGVVKYYAFHMGPYIALILFGIFYSMFRRNRLVTFIWLKTRESSSLLVIFITLGIFFAIAEILPRFLNIALLPDRAWVFAGIFFLAPAFLILQFHPNWSRLSLLIFLLAFVLNIGGALYVNNLKQHLITSAQWQSAKWIINNLPENRLFLSSGNKNLLPFHADSRLFRLPSNLYCGSLDDYLSFVHNIENPDRIPYISSLSLNQMLEEYSVQYQEQYSHTSNIVERKNILKNLGQKIFQDENLPLSLWSPGPFLIAPPQSIKLDPKKRFPVEDIFRQTESDYVLKKSDKLYIYFSRLHPNNPYNKRNYTLTSWGFSGCPNDAPFIFDQYLDKFKQIYNDHGEVIIWEVL